MADTLDTAAPQTVKADTLKTGAAWKKSRWLLVAIAIVSWSCWRFPQFPFDAGNMDACWQAVLVYARETKMQFGHDVVFTNGPLGYLSIGFFSPYAPVTRLFFEAAFGVVIATGLCLLAWRIARPWRLVLLGFFVFLTSPLHWYGDALYADLGLFAWGMLCFLESGPRLRAYVPALVGLAVLGALVKFTFLILGMLTIGLLACDLVLRGRRALAAGMVTGFVLGFLILWKLLGQNLSGLPGYLTSSFAVTEGYSAAMGLNRVNVIWVLLIATGAATAALGRAITSPSVGREPRRVWRIPLLLWLAAILFEEWKYGCVRSDWLHVASMFGIMPIMAIGMEALPAPGKPTVWFARAGIFVCLAAGILFTQSQVGWLAPVKCVGSAYENLSDSFATLTRPAHYLRVQNEALNAEKLKDQLPHIRAAVADSTVDVFGQFQAFAIFNALNYRPRPVFQSYAAYSRRMMELNAEYYSSSNAPQYVLFNLRPIDLRFPPLEDSFLLRHLLLNYEPVLTESNYLLLRQTSVRHVPLKLVREGRARLGEKVNLPDDQKGPLWLEIEVQPSAFDRVRAFLYRPGATQLVIWKQADHDPPLEFPAPAAMLSAGFLISPLALDTQGTVDIYTGDHILRAGAFTVVEAPTELLNSGASSFQYRLFQIE